jgi:hypothetical protein
MMHWLYDMKQDLKINVYGEDITMKECTITEDITLQIIALNNVLLSSISVHF